MSLESRVRLKSSCTVRRGADGKVLRATRVTRRRPTLLLGILRKRGADGDVDFLREALIVLVEGIMDAEVSARTGAGYRERSTERVTQRNGYRSRQWDTRVGTMDLRIPRLRGQLFSEPAGAAAAK